jgi:oxalate decarboxylase/phosphoglucose isomerase-like protein (cupin superfamily)
MLKAMLNLGPCSMLPPHLHPRATNYVVAISGETQTYMINENGARTVQATLTPGKMTIFPTGSVHAMMNVGCENAQLISALNSDDTGTMNLANAFFSLPSNFTQTILGPDANLQALGGDVPAVGTGSVAGPEACIAACKAKGKLVRRSF